MKIEWIFNLFIFSTRIDYREEYQGDYWTTLSISVKSLCRYLKIPVTLKKYVSFLFFIGKYKLLKRNQKIKSEKVFKVVFLNCQSYTRYAPRGATAVKLWTVGYPSWPLPTFLRSRISFLSWISYWEMPQVIRTRYATRGATVAVSVERTAPHNSRIMTGTNLLKKHHIW